MKTIFYVAALLLIIAGALAQPAPQFPGQVESQQQKNNDINALNYALTLEHLEATFYQIGQQRFGVQQFVNAGYSPSVYYYVDLIRTHEALHVTFLTQVIQSLNASAVVPCTYNFDQQGFFNNVSTYLAAAMLLENTGVMAYDGAANTITNADYLTAAATIATTEARHAAYLNELNRVYAFSNASFDTALSPSSIYAMVRPLIASCPANQTQLVDLPQIRSNYVYNFTTDLYNTTSKRDFSRIEKMESARRVYETPAAVANDNAVLNYALHLEQFGYALVTAAQQKFNLSDFIAAGYNQSVYNHFQLIVLHERTHPIFLRSVLQARNAPLIVDPCVYNFNDSLSSVSTFLMTARMVENLEVTAYDGGISAITDESIVQAAATIATIEARHAAYLNLLLLGEGVPQSAFDTIHTPLEILNITAPFFVSCPQQVPIPQAPYYLFATNVAPSVSLSPSSSPVASVSRSVSFSPSRSTSNSQSSTPSNSCSPSPSPCCNSQKSGTTINFFFADMLGGAY